MINQEETPEEIEAQQIVDFIVGILFLVIGVTMTIMAFFMYTPQESLTLLSLWTPTLALTGGGPVSILTGCALVGQDIMRKRMELKDITNEKPYTCF